MPGINENYNPKPDDENDEPNIILHHELEEDYKIGSAATEDDENREMTDYDLDEQIAELDKKIAETQNSGEATVDQIEDLLEQRSSLEALRRDEE
ncbi:MAG: hypothetical protein WCT37_05470 [Patescibacteria group bacterium]|jgi:hypothetical protein